MTGLAQESKTIKKLICGKCAYIVASLENGWLFLKARHIKVYVKGGVARVKCRQCGHTNIFIDEEYKQLHPEIAARLLSENGVCEPETRPWYINDKEKEKKTHV